MTSRSTTSRFTRFYATLPGLTAQLVVMQKELLQIVETAQARRYGTWCSMQSSMRSTKLSKECKLFRNSRRCITIFSASPQYGLPLLGGIIAAMPNATGDARHTATAANCRRKATAELASRHADVGSTLDVLEARKHKPPCPDTQRLEKSMIPPQHPCDTTCPCFVSFRKRAGS